MRKILFAVSLAGALVVTASMAESKNAIVKEVPRDTIAKQMGTPMKEINRPDSQERERWMMRGPMHERKEAGEAFENECGTQGPWAAKMMHPPLCRCRVMAAFLFILCLSVMVLVNILLTILVILDMARLNRFNGLWIPVLLLVGIPGTALYALFRIGDAVYAAEQKIK